MNKSYVKSGTGDRILIKTRTYFARGSNRSQKSAKAFYEHLVRATKDQEDLQSPYTFVAFPRRGGKMAYIIQKAIQKGGSIAVTREETKQAILQTAAIMGIEPPEVVVLKKNEHLERGITLAGVIVDIDTY